MNLGPLMGDLAATQLSAEEREWLRHPLIGAIILFTRNYESPQQLTELVREVREVRPELLIAVDHEGGRVQRFRQGFTVLPAMDGLGELRREDAPAARQAATALGTVLAAELRAHDVDLSFTPVLDLDYGRSGVIGSRAFADEAEAVIDLATALVSGLRRADMAAVGKHYPGHGYVEADSHVAIPVDERPLSVIRSADLQPFAAHARIGLDGVMPAHVVYSQCDSRPAGFSPFWIGLLRRELGFDGAIFSDDLSMEGASVAGDIFGRADAAWQAGCDMLLVCNAQAELIRLLDGWKVEPDAQRAARVARLKPKRAFMSRADLAKEKDYAGALAVLDRFATAFA